MPRSWRMFGWFRRKPAQGKVTTPPVPARSHTAPISHPVVRGRPSYTDYARRTRIRKRMGLAAGVLAALGLGYTAYRFANRPIQPSEPAVPIENTHRNGRRPVEFDPPISHERRPTDILPGETIREYEVRIARERAAAEAAKHQPVKPQPTEKQKFYSETISKKFVNQYLEWKRSATGDAPEINWGRKVWSPESSTPLSETLGPNHVIEITRRVNENGKMVEQKMYAFVEKIPGEEGYAYSIPGPMGGSPEMKSGMYEKGQQFGNNLSKLLNYLGNPTITGVYGPAN